MTRSRSTTFGMTVDAYAKWKRVDAVAVQAALDAGRLTRAMDGTIDPKGPPIGLTQAEYARHREKHGLRGVTRQMVAKAATNGWLTYHVDGTIDPEGSDASWSENATSRLDLDDPKPIETTRQRTLDPGSPAVGSASSPATSRGKAVTGDLEETPEYKASRAEAEFHRARKMRYEADLMEGRSIEKSKVKAAFQEIFFAVQRRVMSLPDRVSAQCAGLDDEQAVHTLLEHECRQALGDGADQIMGTLDLDENDDDE